MPPAVVPPRRGRRPDDPSVVSVVSVVDRLSGRALPGDPAASPNRTDRPTREITRDRNDQAHPQRPKRPKRPKPPRGARKARKAEFGRLGAGARPKRPKAPRTPSPSAHGAPPPCPLGHRDRWQGRDGTIVCAVCYPPPAESLVHARWRPAPSAETPTATSDAAAWFQNALQLFDAELEVPPAFPWPERLPELGTFHVSTFARCACGAGTWVTYGTTPRCERCATGRPAVPVSRACPWTGLFALTWDRVERTDARGETYIAFENPRPKSGRCPWCGHAWAQHRWQADARRRWTESE